MNFQTAFDEDDIETNLIPTSSPTRLDQLQKSTSNKKSVRFQLLYGFIPIYSFCQIFIFFSASAILWNASKCAPVVLFMAYLYFKCFSPKREAQQKVDEFLMLAVEVKICESRKIRENAEMALRSLSSLGYDPGNRCESI